MFISRYIGKSLNVKDINVILNYILTFWNFTVYQKWWLYRASSTLKGRMTLTTWNIDIIQFVKERLLEIYDLSDLEKTIFATNQKMCVCVCVCL